MRTSLFLAVALMVSPAWAEDVGAKPDDPLAALERAEGERAPIGRRGHAARMVKEAQPLAGLERAPVSAAAAQPVLPKPTADIPMPPINFTVEGR